MLVDFSAGVNKAEGKALDRAIRSCPAITDIDRVFVRWEAFAADYGWLTVNELEFYKGGYRYAKQP